MSRAPEPERWLGPHEVDGGRAELLADDDSPGGWLLAVDGVPQSYVDLRDPTHLEFDYVARIGLGLDLLPPGPVAAVHLGGGGCTLARWLAATRPGSRQLVVEADAALAQLVRDALGTQGFKLRVADARAEVGRLRAGEADVVDGDVFGGAVLPRSCATVEHHAGVHRLLRPTGLYALNVADRHPFPFARSQAATLGSLFAEVVVLADPAVLRGRRFGNLVLLASDTPLPLPALTRGASGSVPPARVLAGDALRDWVAGAPVVTDATVGDAPVPPPALFS